MVGRINIYPNATEAMQAMQAMFTAVGLKADLKMLEVSQWLKIWRPPYPEPRQPIAIQGMHDNNNGDAVFTVFNKYHSKGSNSYVSDPQLDALIEKAGVASGAERRRLFQQAFKRANEEIVADIILFHMVGYTRVSKRINFRPSISTNSELHLEDVTFK
jgi:peptide/nickel transport system substrate-binding protein